MNTMSIEVNTDKIINHNPARIKEVVSEHPISSEADLKAKLKLSARAFKTWSKMPAPDRGKYLSAAAEIYRERKEKYANLLHKENGKSISEAKGEIQEVIDTLEFFAGEGRRMYGLTGNSEMPDKAIMTIRQPIGPALLISAWNFPSAVPSWKIAPCLIAGNTFILKPSELASLSGKVLVDVLNEVGLPEGVAQVAFGAGDVGEFLCRSEEIKIVSMTGSTAVGRKVATIAAENFKKCALELGGKNSTIVFDDADLELVKEGLIWGAYGTAGQRCTSTSRLILSKKTAKTLLPDLASEAAKFYDADKKVPADNYAPIISIKQLEKIDRMVQEAISEGAEVVCGAKVLDNGEHMGYFYAPTILKVKPSMKIASEEVFGPVLAVIELEDTEDHEEFLKQALEISNSVNYGLSNAVFTKNINLGLKAVHSFESGLVYLNAPTIGAECGGASFFGGWKQTGNGSREGGLAALDTYTQYKTMSIDYSGKLQKAQISNYD
jgi:aldehyde dehydrogenase (NAD+)